MIVRFNRYCLFTLSALPSPSADGLLTQALLTGNFEAAVEMCLAGGQMAEAILLAIAGGPELLVRTQRKYFLQNKSTLGRVRLFFLLLKNLFFEVRTYRQE